jgi:asparagine synthase (glutamine-hydrolysing)
MGWLPVSVRGLLAVAITTPSPTAWDRLFQVVSPVLPNRLRYQNPGDKMHKLAHILAAPNPKAIYWGLVSLWKDPERLVLASHEPISAFNDDAQQADLREFEHWMMHKDILTYLPDDILVKVDRAAMAVSLETRLPLLDQPLVEFVWSLHLGMKIRGVKRKRLVRKLLYRYVPSELIERPKMGFGIPLAEWLRGPLRDWCEALLDPGRLRNEGYFDHALVQRYWREHLSGSCNWAYYLWNVIAFQAWLEATHG